MPPLRWTSATLRPASGIPLCQSEDSRAPRVCLPRVFFHVCVFHVCVRYSTHEILHEKIGCNLESILETAKFFRGFSKKMKLNLINMLFFRGTYNGDITLIFTFYRYSSPSHLCFPRQDDKAKVCRGHTQTPSLHTLNKATYSWGSKKNRRNIPELED